MVRSIDGEDMSGPIACTCNSVAVVLLALGGYPLTTTSVLAYPTFIDKESYQEQHRAKTIVWISIVRETTATTTTCVAGL